MKKTNEMIYNNILQKLKASKKPNELEGKMISGEEIAKEEKITRSYVSKVIAKLIEKGYDIKRVNRMGYIYQNDMKVLDEEYIKSHLTNQRNVQVLDSVDSTNNYLKKMKKNEKMEEMVVIADAQTAGRGRLGRSFMSNQASGIYMSILLKPTFSLEYAKKLTCLAAAATSLAIDQMAGTKTTIKWVNDIYLNSKKICGILTEGSTSIEQGSLEYVIIGIGINMYHQEFSEDIRRIATTIEDETNQIISRNELIIAIINQIDAYLKNIDDHTYMHEYIKKSFVIGKKVELYQNILKGDYFVDDKKGMVNTRGAAQRVNYKF